MKVTVSAIEKMEVTLDTSRSELEVIITNQVEHVVASVDQQTSGPENIKERRWDYRE
jgi:hypothetical protein